MDLSGRNRCKDWTGNWTDITSWGKISKEKRLGFLGTTSCRETRGEGVSRVVTGKQES